MWQMRCSQEDIRGLVGGDSRAAQDRGCPLGSGVSLGRGSGLLCGTTLGGTTEIEGGLEEGQEWSIFEAHSTQLFFQSCPARLQSREGSQTTTLEGGLQASLGP